MAEQLDDRIDPDDPNVSYFDDEDDTEDYFVNEVEEYFLTEDSGEPSPPISDQTQDYLVIARKCILLVDVCSQMSRDWINADKPYDDPKNTDFTWRPANLCDSDPDSEYKKFVFKDIIWTSFRYGLFLAGVKVEPAAFIATHPDHPDTAFLAFRGSQTGADFGIDGQYDTVPNPLDAKGGLTEKGFSKYFTGLGLNTTDDRNIGKKVPGFTLYETLKKLARKQGIRHLIVSGHSLGSTTATMSGAFAVQTQFFKTVKTYVSASPQVGNADFKTWYHSLTDVDGNLLHENTVRLVNTADGVPSTPNSVAPKPNKVYEHVGKQIDFTADYSDGGKNHNPCCTYSYALHNFTDPVNPDLTCDFPQNQLDDRIDPDDPNVSYFDDEDDTEDYFVNEVEEYFLTEDSGEPSPPINLNEYEVVHTDNPRKTRIFVLRTY